MWASFSMILVYVVSAPHHPGDLPEKTVAAIIKEAGLTVDEFLDL